MNHIWIIEYKHSKKGWVPFDLNHTRKEAYDQMRLYKRVGTRRYRVKKWVRKEDGE